MMHRSHIFALVMLCSVVCTASIQGPSDNPDHPVGNHHELTLAGLQPGRSHLTDALRRFSRHWKHPSEEEPDVYVWNLAGVQVSVEVDDQKVVRVVTVEDHRIHAVAPAMPVLKRLETGRRLRLGDAPERLLALYGKPFFRGPASLEGRDVQLIVFNFSWAGAGVPQILESTFDQGRLIRMVLSADYY